MPRRSVGNAKRTWCKQNIHFLEDALKSADSSSFFQGVVKIRLRIATCLLNRTLNQDETLSNDGSRPHELLAIPTYE